MTMTIKTPYEYGKEAYEKGITAPALDKEFQDIHLTELPIGDAAINALIGWQRGWHDALREFVAIPVFEVVFKNGDMNLLQGKTIELAVKEAGYSMSDVHTYEKI